MPKRSNDFQRLVFLLQTHFADNALVTESAMLVDSRTGKEREVDITIEKEVAGHSILISIECVDRSRKIDTGWVEQMKSKHEHLPTNKLVLASRSGFYAPALEVAELNGFSTLVYESASESDLTGLFEVLGTSYLQLVSSSITEAVIYTRSGPTTEQKALRASPDLALYDSSGNLIGDLRSMIERALRSRSVSQRLVTEGTADDRFFELRWDPIDSRSGEAALFLLEQDKNELHVVEQIHVVGEYCYEPNRVKLEPAKLGGDVISWGAGFVKGAKTIAAISKGTSSGGMLSVFGADGLKQCERFEFLSSTKQAEQQ